MEAAHAVTLEHVIRRSALQCVTQCLRHDTCTAVASVKQNGATSVSCFLLGGISRDMTTVSENPSEETCTMYVMNPCPAGTTVYRGYCKCPPGKTGQFCQLTNPETCSSAWKSVYITNGTGDKDMVINANSNNFRSYIQTAFNRLDGSVLIFRGKWFSVNGDGFASLVTPTLSRKSWNEFADTPVRMYWLVKSNGDVQRFKETSSTFTDFVKTVEWFIRQPHGAELLYSYNGDGQAVSGTVDDVIQAVENGQDILSYNALYMEPGENRVLLNQYHGQISISKIPTYTFKTTPYWLNFKSATDGELDVQRFYIVSDAYKNAQHTYGGNKLFVDVCWTQAYHDAFSNKNVGYLVSAVLNGHAVRVVVSNLALTVDHVVINTDTVMFGTRPFLDPVGVGTFSASSQAVRVVATTDGMKFTCRAIPTAGSVIQSTTSSAPVAWFVDTRQRSRVYSVTSEGAVRHGTEVELYTRLRKGASLTVGVTFSQPGHYLLLLVSAVDLTIAGRVVAMVEDLSRLPIPKGQVTSPLECGLRALLVTSQGLVRTYEYKHREAGTHGVLSSVTIDWFLDSYDHS